MATIQERQALLQRYSQAYAEVQQALETFPRHSWHFKPAPHEWSIHEILIHLADAEVHGFIRIRTALAEPGSPISVYDQDRYAERLYYHEQNTEEVLHLFRLLRQTTYQLLTLLPESAWSNTVQHPESGILSLDDLLQTYTEHVLVHIEQMRKNVQLWREQEHA
ncbi:DinB family protein [Thermosporothrix hazakensis]|jgi:hypothetical protein|uniref:DinB family protein n=1 Tax=Thermosporothrix hazakensis TaxID=644383 RepID=A0A326U3Q1_THEHA|nr:DinB family protein [Thermosporothrix hazakensis]PZW26100.1 DinB family protein [Thermosporothrix hazakensis]GCE51360.1 hypothetical protein KTH_62290 [Thermosporothrix hazakensis]